MAKTAMQQLIELNAERNRQLAAIRQLTLCGWCELADRLGVDRNDREHAAKVLALRAING